MRESHRKEVAFERVLFFCDAVAAIAITLLALNLKLNVPDGQPLTFADMIAPWHQYVAFLLSFFTIALCWRSHHDFFIYITKMNAAMVTLNVWWLLFIVILPFSTSLLSSHFGDVPAMLVYCSNIFVISIFQNMIWDYACRQKFVDEEKLDEYPQLKTRINLMVNLDMINGVIAVGLCFFMPKTAFFLQFFKVPVFVIAAFYVARLRRAELKGKDTHETIERP